MNAEVTCDYGLLHISPRTVTGTRGNQVYLASGESGQVCYREGSSLPDNDMAGFYYLGTIGGSGSDSIQEYVDVSDHYNEEKTLYLLELSPPSTEGGFYDIISIQEIGLTKDSAKATLTLPVVTKGSEENLDITDGLKITAVLNGDTMDVVNVGSFVYSLILYSDKKHNLASGDIYDIDGAQLIKEIRLNKNQSEYTITDNVSDFEPSETYYYSLCIRAQSPSGNNAGDPVFCTQASGDTFSCLEFDPTTTPEDLCVVDKEENIVSVQNSWAQDSYGKVVDVGTVEGDVKEEGAIVFSKMDADPNYLHVIAFQTGDINSVETWMKSNASEYVAIAKAEIPSEITNYNPVITGSIRMQLRKVVKGSADISVTTNTVTYNGESHNVDDFISNVKVNGDEITDYEASFVTDINGSTALTTDVVNAGTYYIKVSVKGTDNYDAGDSVIGVELQKRQLSISGTKVADKVYDGTTGADITVGELSGVAAADLGTVTVSPDGAFGSKNVGTYDVVISYTLTGNAKDNYEAPASQTFSKQITAKQLRVSGTKVAAKPYDGTTAAVVTLGDVEGKVPGDDVTVSAVGTFDSPNKGARTVSVEYSLSGTDAGNYYLAPSQEQFNAQITAADSDSDLDFVGGSVTYDGAAHGFVLSGTEAGDVVTYTYEGAESSDMPTFTDAGSYTVSVKVSRDNYEDWTKSATLSISKKALTLIFTAADKDYDGTTDAEITDWTLTGLVDGETATVSGYAGAFADKNVGTDKAVTVSGYTISGASLDNYELTVADVTANITAKELTVNFAAEDKEYDGNVSTTAAFASFDGLVSGDNVTVTVNSASFADKNVGADKAVTVDYAASGADLGNYVLAASETTADITQKPVGVIGIVKIASKTYDGTTTIDSGTITYLSTPRGVLTDDENSVSVSATATTEYVNVGDYEDGATITFTLNDLTGNYKLSTVTKTADFSITPATITDVSLTGFSGSYDGSAHSIQVNAKSGDEVQFSTDETTYSTTNPSFTEVGTYTVYVKVSRTNYNDWTGSAVVEITKQVAAPLTYTLSQNGRASTYDGRREYDHDARETTEIYLAFESDPGEITRDNINLISDYVVMDSTTDITKKEENGSYIVTIPIIRTNEVSDTGIDTASLAITGMPNIDDTSKTFNTYIPVLYWGIVASAFGEQADITEEKLLTNKSIHALTVNDPEDPYGIYVDTTNQNVLLYSGITCVADDDWTPIIEEKGWVEGVDEDTDDNIADRGGNTIAIARFSTKTITDILQLAVNISQMAGYTSYTADIKSKTYTGYKSINRKAQTCDGKYTCKIE